MPPNRSKRSTLTCVWCQSATRPPQSWSRPLKPLRRVGLFPPASTPASGERPYPGQVFETSGSSYAEQMTAYAQQRAAKRQERRQRRAPAEPLARGQLPLEGEAVGNKGRRTRLGHAPD